MPIECDGDWMGMCTPACSADQCCAPQHGHFTCVARNADGTCPLGDLFIDSRYIDGTRGTYQVDYRTFAADACEIDSTHLNADEVVERIMELARERKLTAGD